MKAPRPRSDERPRALADLGDGRILGLRNHGLVTIGRSVGDAFAAIYNMERAYEMRLSIRQSDAEFFPIPKPVMQDANARAKDRFAGSGPR